MQKATCEKLAAPGTSRFSASARFGVSAVRNLVRKADPPDAAFVDELRGGQGHALHVVAINEMRGDANRVRLAAVVLHVVLRDDVRAPHALRFADVELVREIAVVDEFVLVQAPAAHLRHVLGHALIVSQEVEQAERVVFMIGVNLRAALHNRHWASRTALRSCQAR